MRVFFFIFLVSVQALALNVPPLTGPVVDQARLLNDTDKRSIEKLIRAVNDAGLAQMQVLTLPSLQDETIEGYSIKVVDQWQLGTGKKDNGLLLLVALAEKKMRIEVGQGLEGQIPDVIAKRIISDKMVPVFQTHGASDGILVGVAALIQRIDPNWDFSTDDNLRRASVQKRGSSLMFFVLLIVFIVLMSSRSGRDILLAFLILSVSRRSGGFGSYGGGSGGGWSGGGGGFSGGGASGGW